MPMDTPDMSTTEVFFAGVGVGGGLCLLLVLFLITATSMRTKETWQDLAVKAGKAEYYLDADNVRQWRWK